MYPHGNVLKAVRDNFLQWKLQTSFQKLQLLRQQLTLEEQFENTLTLFHPQSSDSFPRKELAQNPERDARYCFPVYETTFCTAEQHCVATIRSNRCHFAMSHFCVLPRFTKSGFETSFVLYQWAADERGREGRGVGGLQTAPGSHGNNVHIIAAALHQPKMPRRAKRTRERSECDGSAN